MVFLLIITRALDLSIKVALAMQL